MTFDEFKKVELRAGKIVIAERVEGSEKLVRLEVDLGEKAEDGSLALRQVVAGIAAVYEPADLIGKQIVVVANLEARKLMGLESQGMLLAAHDQEGKAVLIIPFTEVPVGSLIG